MDAVIALDTDASFASYKVARELNKKIPDDMAVIDMLGTYGTLLTPELTTINQHSYTMGKTAATLLLETKITQQRPFPVINSTLSERDSS